MRDCGRDKFMYKNIKIKIYGRVQGVWFRESAKKKAGELNISGWARNEADGSLYVEVQGTLEAIAEMKRLRSHVGL